MYLLLKMGIFQPAMLVYQRVNIVFLPGFGGLGSNLQPRHEAPFLSLPFAAASLVTPQRWPDFRQGETTVEMCVSQLLVEKHPPKMIEIFTIQLGRCNIPIIFQPFLLCFFFSSSEFLGVFTHWDSQKSLAKPGGLSKRLSTLMGPHLQFNSASNILQVAEKMQAPCAQMMPVKWLEGCLLALSCRW